MDKRIVGYILNDRNEPVPCYDLIKWAMWFERAGKQRIVAKTELPNGILISTVFLGLDYNFRRKGPPILFESMIFGGKNDQTLYRYATWKEAEDGHENAVQYFLKKVEHEN